MAAMVPQLLHLHQTAGKKPIEERF